MSDLNLKRNRDKMIVYAVNATRTFKEAGDKIGMTESAIQKAYNKIASHA